MKIQVLGTGCPKCKKLAELAEQTASEMQLDYTLEKVTKIDQIMAFGVMVTPALAIDGHVVVAGKIPTKQELQTMLKV